MRLDRRHELRINLGCRLHRLCSTPCDAAHRTSGTTLEIETVISVGLQSLADRLDHFSSSASRDCNFFLAHNSSIASPYASCRSLSWRSYCSPHILRIGPQDVLHAPLAVIAHCSTSDGARVVLTARPGHGGLTLDDVQHQRAFALGGPTLDVFFHLRAQRRFLDYDVSRISLGRYKIIKTRRHFASNEAAVKLLWLTPRNVLAKSVRTAYGWKAAMNQFSILFAERFAAARE